VLAERPPWQADAACLVAGPLGFIEPGPGRKDRWRRDVCAGCPVRRDCAAAALAHLERHEVLFGMWAGVPITDRGRRRDVLRELREVVGVATIHDGSEVHG
jgi:hypothetical protein